METKSDEQIERLSEKTVSVHRSDNFDSNEEYWNNSSYANGSSDDELPLAERSTRRAAANAMIPPDMSQTSRLEPQRRRRGGPPYQENTQLYQEEDTDFKVSTPPVRRRRRNAPHSYGPGDFHIYQEEATAETDEEMAKRLQEQFKREAGFSDAATNNARCPADLASDVQIPWIGPHADRGDTPVEMQGIHGDAGHPAYQNTELTGPVFGMIPSPAIRHSISQQFSVHSTCWENRFDHLPFRTSCNFCVLEMIACSEHHPSSRICYRHGRPRTYIPAFLNNAGLEDAYDALQDEPPPKKRQISGVRKFVAKPKPPKVLPLKKQEAILRELQPKDEERGPPPA